MGTLEDVNDWLITPVRHIALDDEDVSRMCVKSDSVLWIPERDIALKTCLVLHAHMEQVGHHGVVAALYRLRNFGAWSGMDKHVAEFVRQCLHHGSPKEKEIVLGPFGE